MHLFLDKDLAIGYKSHSQKIRVQTEQWVEQSIFCPSCGNEQIDRFPNNSPVADFFCTGCYEEFELKSKGEPLGAKVVDGAYSTMISRLTVANNPNFFFLTYQPSSGLIENFCVVPKHFFVPAIIEKRPPLSKTSRRRGWVGCNILLNSIPLAGRIYYLKNNQLQSRDQIIHKWQKGLWLKNEADVNAKSWLLDIMRCIEKINLETFTLDQLYAFESELSQLHPQNKHVKAKIRQQLQVLRDKGYLEFTSHGTYKIAI